MNSPARTASSPDDIDRAEAALVRRLDRHARILERLERNQEIAI